ncbi:von Willebrand factor type A [Halalkaliarchaeum desulfuricum]|uniref:von Willebrand factor type A n=1 Tax=Halalkaliarchaeum desulfuricum TaxID=2055893 RepID=A0A343TMR4_9EURY|nr:SipW-dependent-type signal peptide-containing protein [Halalkaliarchaeum desulfuricum]AUX10386.1 von Willebrand factor type A [Halalkaliarchaeum desulfuricum]
MSKESSFELSRRKALAGIGAVGVASTGAGFGTSAYFSDEESFENNTMTAGELDLRLDWQQLYWGMPYYHDQAPYGSAGRPFVNAHPDHDDDGMQSLDDDTRYVDGDPGDDMNWSMEDVEDGANIQEDLTCETLDNFGDPDSFHNDNGFEPDSLIDLDDVKPGDCGEVTFSYHLCDNPGYVWLFGELADDIDDELAEAIEVKFWYDLGCNNVFDEEQDQLIFQWGSMAELLPYLTEGLQLDPRVYGENHDGDTGDGGDDSGECVKVGKVDVNEDGTFGEVDGGTKENGNVFNFDDDANAPPWSGGGDYKARDVTVEVEITEFEDEDNEEEPVSIKAEVIDGDYGLCRIRVNGGQDSETFYDLGEGEEACVTETRELETNLRNPGDQRAAISNIEFFVCDIDEDDVPPPNLCFPADETFCVGFKWCLPTDVDVETIDGIDDINDLQAMSLSFDLGFYTEQCRHNDDPTGPSGAMD